MVMVRQDSFDIARLFARAPRHGRDMARARISVVRPIAATRGAALKTSGTKTLKTTTA
ncbi:hypothetical protein SAMN02745172_01159 [Pseudoxanthobacter soli DSM 19599]|uniref:Uncharacterized protein n=2 Tax=Pseudoxanthobacter TaxID=433838 RepID=A0A1M7ZD28_9HYPH|nr:hypothetical protein SAMN02745172_01159 [Pseudoxanthobacter soli DSM 19599]